MPHYERLAHTSTFHVATPSLDTVDCQPLSAKLHLPSDITSPPPPPPEPPPVIDSDQTLLKSSDAPDDLPEHVQILFLQTVEDVHLSSDTTRDLRALLHDHAQTFAKNSADLGYCNILQHDIDTGDAYPIKQLSLIHI